jgi:hypothetical protein
VAAAALVISAGSAYGEIDYVPQGYALPYFEISGKITRPDGVPVSQHQVFIHRLIDGGPEGTLTAYTDNGGNFAFNIYAMHYEYGIAVNDDIKAKTGADQYFIGVFQKEGYGKNPVALDTLGAWDPVQGYTVLADIALVEGEGPLPVPEGTVPLTISRRDSDIVLNWDAASYGVIDLYACTGDGSGSYSNAASAWEFLSDPSGGEYVDGGQVGSGNAEKYYKALVEGQAPDANHPLGGTYIGQAPAVGKVNVVVHLDWNLISPIVFGDDLNNTLGTGFSDNEQLWKWNPAEQQFESPLTFKAGGWTAPAGATWTNVDNGVGYGINILSLPGGQDQKIITVIGKVRDTDFQSAIKTDWNKIGYPFPVGIGLNSALSGFTAGKSKVNDQVWPWLWNAAEGGHFGAPSVFNGTRWNPELQLTPGVGYGYNHLGSGFDWEVNKEQALQ